MRGNISRYLGGLLLALLLGVAEPAGAAAPPPAAAAPVPAAAPAGAGVRLRQPAPGRLRELRRQRAFRYVEVRSELSAWDLFWAAVFRRLGGWLSTRSGSVAWRYGFYVVLVAAFALVVLRLLKVELTGAFGRAPRRAGLPYDTEAEDIHELDFAARLAEAEAAGNYRLAVRLGYLQVLKHLTDQGAIQWQPDKTNHAYVRELAARPRAQAAFAELTRQFEYVWYGELALSPAQYARTQTDRTAFLTQFASSRAA